MENLNDLLAGTGVTTQDETVKTMLEKYGLNWTVSKQPLSLPDGTKTPFFGIVRDDTKTTFTTTKEGYEPFQNSELIELVNAAAGKLGLSVNNAGSFKDGGLVFVQIETGMIKGIGENKDNVKKYVSGMNSHNGALSLRFGMNNLTISCLNTFYAAAKEMKNSVRHTQSMRAKIDEIVKELEGVQAKEKSLYDTFFKFAEMPIKKVFIEDVVKLVLDIDLGGKKEDLSTYQVNRLTDLSRAIVTETVQKGETLWGLFSGVTKYTTHFAPGKIDSRAQSKAIGKSYESDNKVFSRFAEIIS